MKDCFSFVDLRKSNRYDIAFRTGIGRRDMQQDAGYVAACDNEVLAVVCDGMGGMAVHHQDFPGLQPAGSLLKNS